MSQEINQKLLTRITKVVAHPHSHVVAHDHDRAIAIMMIIQDYLTTEAVSFVDELYGQLNKEDRKKVDEVLRYT